MSKDFHHPYKPYEIQVELMEQIYDLLDSKKKVGIFESPTGTGKTLSLICSAVTWLRENKAKFGSEENLLNEGTNFKDDEDDSSSFSSFDDEPKWVNEFHNDRIAMEKSSIFQDYENYLATLDPQNIKPMVRSLEKKNKEIGAGQGKRKRIIPHIEIANEDEDSFVVDPYESDSNNTGTEDQREQLNEEIQRLLEKVDGRYKSKVEQNLEYKSPVRIYFSSRTHSQLNQFAHQLTLPVFPASYSGMKSEKIKYLPLASRKQLCIHKKISKLKSDLITESCLEAVQKKDCQFYTNGQDALAWKQFRDYSFAQIQDIEDLVQLGHSLNVCPYYASRKSLESAEIITLPYQHLLSSEARRSMGIDLHNSIIIIDEAHNLIDTITSIYSSSVSLIELKQSKQALKLYLNKFKRRLNSGNRVNILKLMKLIDILIGYMETKYSIGKEISAQDIFEGSNADLLNIHKIVKYMKASKIAYKVDSYLDWNTRQAELQSNGNVKKEPLLFKISSFISTFSNPSSEGSFFFDKNDTIKYMLLEPKEIFKQITDESKCVILAGGTLQPTEEIISSLIPYLPLSLIAQFSCNHVIPDSNLNTYIVSDGFDFTFEKRNDKNMVARLFKFVLQLCQNVPYGMVLFFPSYKYLEVVIKTWREMDFYKQLNDIKKIFYETGEDIDILSEYSKVIMEDKSGAILFSVVGGKLSEGINFQDNLARAVAMVGLPFPNNFSAELIIKKKHIERKIILEGGTVQEASKATREFYENLCMKSVNQSVGRAIRHAKDYSNIYLIDKRYANHNIKLKLSEWVRKRIQPCTSIEDILEETKSFFKKKLNDN